MRTRAIAYPTKIATCCFCGAKAALRLDEGRHELACASCGAPLHDLKMMPKAAPAKPAVTHQPKVRSFAQPKRSEKKVKSKPRKRSKRKGWFGERFKDLAEDLFDVVEDIFD